MSLLDDLWLSGDEFRRGKEWNFAKCEGLFLLVALYLGETVHPVGLGIHGMVPVIWVTLDGVEGTHKVYEFTHYPPGGIPYVAYASTFDFQDFVPTHLQPPKNL